MTTRDPKRDDLADLEHRLPPLPPEPPSTYAKRWPSWTAEGTAVLATLSPDDAARLDDAVQDRWAAEDAAEQEAAEERREQARTRAARQAREAEIREAEAADAAKKRELDLVEQRLRLNDRLRRLRNRRDGDAEGRA